MIITKKDKIDINKKYEPVVVLLDLAMFPSFKFSLTRTSQSFNEYVEDNIKFKKYNNTYLEQTMSFTEAKQFTKSRTFLSNADVNNMLKISVKSLILEKYLKYLVGFNFDYLDVIDNNQTVDEGSEETFNKILEENELTESDETVSRLKKLLFEKSTLFNNKKVEYETLAQNEIVKTFHIILDVKNDFTPVRLGVMTNDYDKHRSLNNYEFEVKYEIVDLNEDYSSVDLGSLFDSESE
jgi:hypothetical protein